MRVSGRPGNTAKLEIGSLSPLARIDPAGGAEYSACAHHRRAGLGEPDGDDRRRQKNPVGERGPPGILGERNREAREPPLQHSGNLGLPETLRTVVLKNRPLVAYSRRDAWERHQMLRERALSRQWIMSETPSLGTSRRGVAVFQHAACPAVLRRLSERALHRSHALPWCRVRGVSPRVLSIVVNASPRI